MSFKYDDIDNEIAKHETICEFKKATKETHNATCFGSSVLITGELLKNTELWERNEYVHLWKNNLMVLQ
jgi:hypothetical protein